MLPVYRPNFVEFPRTTKKKVRQAWSIPLDLVHDEYGVVTNTDKALVWQVEYRINNKPTIVAKAIVKFWTPFVATNHQLLP
jgi:hypothetical protein